MINRFYMAGKPENEPIVIEEQPRQFIAEDVKYTLSNYFLGKIHSMIDELMVCESPIEQLMCLALKNNECQMRDYADCRTFSLIPQHEIIANGREYRLDFHLGLSVDNRPLKLAIECDGHQFHEKTKEQVARDKRREHDLILTGYVVVRFPGSEVYKDAAACADVVLQIIKNHANAQAASGS